MTYVMEWKAELSLYPTDLAITRPSLYPLTNCLHPDKYRKRLSTVLGWQCIHCRDIVIAPMAVRYYE